MREFCFQRTGEFAFKFSHVAINKAYRWLSIVKVSPTERTDMHRLCTLALWSNWEPSTCQRLKNWAFCQGSAQGSLCIVAYVYVNGQVSLGHVRLYLWFERGSSCSLERSTRVDLFEHGSSFCFVAMKPCVFSSRPFSEIRRKPAAAVDF